jgi:hypothetical protein
MWKSGHWKRFSCRPRRQRHAGCWMCRENRRSFNLRGGGHQLDVLLDVRDTFHRLQHCRATFEEVAALSVEGLNKAASLESNELHGNRCIASWREQPPGVVGLIIEKRKAFPSRSFKPMTSARSLGQGRADLGLGRDRRPSTLVGKRSYLDAGPISRRLPLAEFRNCPLIR